MIKLVTLSAKNDRHTLSINNFKINLNLSDSWTKIDNFGICSYKNVLCNFEKGNKQYFLIFDSLFIQSNKNEINLFYREKVHTYVQDDKNKKGVKVLDKKYKEMNKELFKVSFNSLFNNKLVAKKEELKWEIFKLKAQVYFSLFENEEVWN
ncbi:hypothetical protein MM26B8_01490 [Mycoplasmopsis meleagridis]|uniref:Uncharacterized protein n=1 Tax=Mycoplasmopsis meleagridis ATCC 25294 TaxID=1264554 RepID=A0A0F5H1A5_9BACT|nr:hypothetical protein [Mycoplasmopsis meleagridis]KKB26935.1 hypothetical protein MMELEA_03850 [Mycoplasmopsis meleagridis ATCC 25294]OAD18524.1 hypothetical protein MM26B8_01490 [Mycoplasmopsis meleagridis]VEU77607.1 Uncharacterised protein [Mycoplasmopsis meleagridis]